MTLTPLTVEGGYQTCSACAEFLLNGDAAFVDNTGAYFHPKCAPALPSTSQVRVDKNNRKALRVAAYQKAVAPESDPKYWENILTDMPDPDKPGRESQYTTSGPDSDEIESDPIPHTGQRWNGNVLADCREYLDEMAARCDRPLVARLMVEIAERQVLWNERKNLYTLWAPARLEADKKAVHPPFLDTGDLRESVGLNTIEISPGRHVLVDSLPTEESPSDEF